MKCTIAAISAALLVLGGMATATAAYADDGTTTSTVSDEGSSSGGSGGSGDSGGSWGAGATGGTEAGDPASSGSGDASPGGGAGGDSSGDAAPPATDGTDGTGTGAGAAGPEAPAPTSDDESGDPEGSGPAAPAAGPSGPSDSGDSGDTGGSGDDGGATPPATVNELTYPFAPMPAACTSDFGYSDRTIPSSDGYYFPDGATYHGDIVEWWAVWESDVDWVNSNGTKPGATVYQATRFTRDQPIPALHMVDSVERTVTGWFHLVPVDPGFQPVVGEPYPSDADYTRAWCRFSAQTVLPAATPTAVSAAEAPAAPTASRPAVAAAVRTLAETGGSADSALGALTLGLLLGMLGLAALRYERWRQRHPVADRT